MTEKINLLAIDPGLREMGYAHFLGDELLDQNVKSLRRPGGRENRLTVFERVLKTLAAEKDPAVIAIEKNSFHQARHNLSLLIAIQRVKSLCRKRNIRLYEFAPNTIKKVVTDDGHATKRMVAKVLCLAYPDLKVHLSAKRQWQERYYQNLFDAVACGVTYLKLSNDNRLFEYEH